MSRKKEARKLNRKLRKKARKENRVKKREQRKKEGKAVGLGRIFEGPQKAIIPFVNAMAVILKSKGIKPERNLFKLVRQFYNAVVRVDNDFADSFVTDILSIIKVVISFFAKKDKDSRETGVVLDKSVRLGLKQAEIDATKIQRAGGLDLALQNKQLRRDLVIDTKDRTLPNNRLITTLLSLSAAAIGVGIAFNRGK